MGYYGTNNIVYVYSPVSVFNAMKRSKSFCKVTHDVFDDMVDAENNYNGGHYKCVEAGTRHFESYDDALKYGTRVASHIRALFLIDGQNMSYEERQKHTGKAIVNLITDTNTIYIRGYVLDAMAIFYKALKNNNITCCICDNKISKRSHASVVSAKVSDDFLSVEAICSDCEKHFNWEGIDRLSIYGRYPKRIENEHELLLKILESTKEIK